MVEHGWNPLPVAIFWLPSDNPRPLPGPPATTDPLYGPSASTAARRTARSSPSTWSPAVESAKVGSVHGPPAITGACTAAGLGWAFGIAALVCATVLTIAARLPAARCTTRFFCAAALQPRHTTHARSDERRVG